MRGKILPDFVKETKTNSAEDVTVDKTVGKKPESKKVHNLSSGLVFTAPVENNKDWKNSPAVKTVGEFSLSKKSFRQEMNIE